MNVVVRRETFEDLVSRDQMGDSEPSDRGARTVRRSEAWPERPGREAPESGE